MRRHAIEFVGEVFDLVAGVNFDLVAEIAFGELRRPVPDRLDRHSHPTRQQHAGADTEHQRESKNDGEALKQIGDGA